MIIQTCKRKPLNVLESSLNRQHEVSCKLNDAMNGKRKVYLDTKITWYISIHIYLYYKEKVSKY